MPDMKIYQAGETVAATLTLEPGHAVPTQVWVSLDLQAEPGAPPAPPLTNRIADLTLQTVMTPAAATASITTGSEAAPVKLTVQAVVPKHIVGGVYKATNALFFMPDGSQHRIAEPDPDGDYLRHIADDPPVAFDTPVIKDLD